MGCPCRTEIGSYAAPRRATRSSSSRRRSGSPRPPRASSSGAATPTRRRRDAFLEGELPAHDPFALGDMAAACDAIRAAIAAGHADLRPRRLRRRRHLRDRARGPDPARARRGRRAGTCRAASTRATASAARRSTRLADEGVRARPDRRLRRSRPSTRSPTRRALGLEVVVTDHHRAGPRAARLPGRRDRYRGDYPFPGSAAPASSTSSARRCSAPGSPVLERHLDLVALATVADVVPLVDENRALARRGPARARHGRRSRACAR